jgi:hypothetical protein
MALSEIKTKKTNAKKEAVKKNEKNIETTIKVINQIPEAPTKRSKKNAKN